MNGHGRNSISSTPYLLKAEQTFLLFSSIKNYYYEFYRGKSGRTIKITYIPNVLYRDIPLGNNVQQYSKSV